MLPFKHNCVVIWLSVRTQRLEHSKPDLKAEPLNGMPTADLVTLEVMKEIREDLLQRWFWQRICGHQMSDACSGRVDFQVASLLVIP